MRRVVTLFAVMALAIATAIPAFAGTNTDRPEPRPTSRAPISLADSGALTAQDTIKVFVQLAGPSVADFVATEVEAGRPEPSKDEQKARAEEIEREHDEVDDDIVRAGAEIVNELKVGANGFIVDVNPRDLPALAGIPGVISVARVATFTPANETSVPWIGAPEVWKNLGFTGDGVTIAVIDTGIDYTHATFGGAGAAAYAANDPTIIEPGTFPTAKVIGGYDFAGTSYDAGGQVGSTTPTPDPDPLDGHGHGTHVSGSAAGMGVLDDGTTFTGPYSPDAYTNYTFEVGPGVAPKASIYAFKVFGDIAGSTTLTSLAIERALDPDQNGSIDDRVDVINMSLGSPFGSPNDPSAIASANAVRLGVVVVAAAGNEGNVPYVTGAPAVGEGVISVAASVDGGLTVGAMQVNAPSFTGLVEAAEGAITAPGSFAGELVVADPLDACDPLVNGTEINGKVALIQRGTCFFSTKILDAQAAGATAVVVFNNRPGPPIVMGGDPAGITIPGVMISQTDGLLILGDILAGGTVTVNFDPSLELAKPELADTIASFSSRGPGVTNLFKPDVSAPGFSIASAAVATGTGAALSSGTSMATPHVAGLAALVLESNPGFEPADVKALIQNGSVVGSTTGGVPYPLTRQGVGVVRADRTLSLGALAKPGGVSFGYINETDREDAEREVEVVNLRDYPQTFTVTVTPNQAVPGVTIKAPATVTVGANDSAEIELEVEVDPAAMPWDFGGNSQLEFDGWVTLTSADDTIQVGYLAVVDPASKMKVEAEDNALDFENDSDTFGWAEGFTLAARGGLLLDKTAFAIDATGFRTNTLFGTPVVQFGVSADKAWNSLSEGEIDIWLDVDKDGVDDYVLVAADLGFLLGGDPTGDVVTALFDLRTGDGFLEWFVDVDLNDRVSVLTVDRTGPFGFLDPGDTTFNYTMVMFGRAGSVDLQFGSVDLADEVVPAAARFGLAPGGAVTIDIPGDSDNAMVWFFANNEEKKQVKVVEFEGKKKDDGKNKDDGKKKDDDHDKKPE